MPLVDGKVVTKDQLEVLLKKQRERLEREAERSSVRDRFWTDLRILRRWKKITTIQDLSRACRRIVADEGMSRVAAARVLGVVERIPAEILRIWMKRPR